MNIESFHAMNYRFPVVKARWRNQLEGLTPDGHSAARGWSNIGSHLEFTFSNKQTFCLTQAEVIQNEGNVRWHA